MYFKKLELIGFKSFFNKTALNFEPGISAIVGPNGCGKSNLFDGIRWVLGEQSVKALRGSDMQDVIFSGTDTKEPLSMAEVTLTMDNSEKYFPVEHPEVAITRRVFRSGESEYLLNKALVRLKDILDLLAGTGIGAESYSLVQQGKIDLVLSSRPEDRRLVFDEAAGITKYKAQKKEASRKLEETEQNLLRVNDIIVEVKRQIGSLERQANKARKYKETFEELKTKEVTLAVLRKDELNKQREKLISELKGLESQEIRLLNEINDQESKITNHQAELKNLQDYISNIKNQILNLENLVSRNIERINFNQERITELEASKKYLETQEEQTKNRLVVDEEKLNNLKTEYALIKKNIEEKSVFLKENEDCLNDITSSIKKSLENISQAKRNILDLITKITHAKNEVTALASKEQVHLARKKRLEIEKAKINEEKTVFEENLNAIAKELESLQKTFQELTLKISEIKKESELKTADLNDINSNISLLEKELLTLQSQKEFIDMLRAKYEGIGESMNAVIYLDKPPEKKVNGLVIKIKDYINLSDEDKAYFDPACFKLSGEAKPVDLDTEKINEKIVSIQKNIETLKISKTEKETRIQELNKEILQLQQDLRNLEIVLANKKANQETILEQFNKIKEEEDITIIELSDMEKEIAVCIDKLSLLKTKLTELEKQEKAQGDLITTEQNNINLNNNKKEEVLVIVAQTKTELGSLNKRIDLQDPTLKALDDTYRQDKEMLVNLENKLKEFRERQTTLKAEIKDLETRIVEDNQNIQIQNGLLKETENKYKEISKGISDVVERIELDKKAHDRLKNRLHELQLQNKDIDFKILSIKERTLEVYKTDLDMLQDSAFVIPQGPDVQAVSGEIQKLKEKLDSLGSVNLVAIEEYDELKKRYDFLTQQQNDLISAKESLHEAIQKINRTAKKMFLETFQNIGLEFRNYFRLLFNGGDARIFLIDEQDPLESGIEIICRPPGKKLQNVLLLSGGEKSLSAIALIFAIFKVKPAPFCVLDEIDAALDEANVDRFSRLLQEFARDSQFIVITHNKRTIANADIMYGITMEESGVSKIVSVKLAQNRPTNDKEPATQPVAEPIPLR